jgi:hypothetical protein
MKKAIVQFFRPESTSYKYPKSADEVIAHVERILNRKSGVWDENDMKGYFTDRFSFTFWVVRTGSGRTLLSTGTITAKIASTPDGNTEIIVKPDTGAGYHFLFVLSILLACGYFYNYATAGALTDIFLGLGMLVLGPAFLIWHSGIWISAIHRRYLMYIHIPLTSRSTPSTPED